MATDPARRDALARRIAWLENVSFHTCEDEQELASLKRELYGLDRTPDERARRAAARAACLRSREAWLQKHGPRYTAWQSWRLTRWKL